jgi:hypothetical protein
MLPVNGTKHIILYYPEGYVGINFNGNGVFFYNGSLFINGLRSKIYNAATKKPLQYQLQRPPIN